MGMFPVHEHNRAAVSESHLPGPLPLTLVDRLPPSRLAWQRPRQTTVPFADIIHHYKRLAEESNKFLLNECRLNK
ncbi:hypothetical protein A7K91_11115 [Paenibacillus oryzae]|uniref:Uncharacterized protein n=1 Tax=Paenibacillus oryzae TaxID=1844972 RepID=A0A1A5YTV4_9BACL|nr:hypothetical protein A7K91_11115 [Paenibacillus oryzae]